MSRISLVLQASSLCFLFLTHQIEGARFFSSIQQENCSSLGQYELYGLAKRKLVSSNSSTNGTTILRDSSNRLDEAQIVSLLSPPDKYYGLHATMDVYGHKLKPGQLSSTGLTVSHYGDGSAQNSIEVGWHIYPELYGDSDPHFYTYWTRDGYDKTGCFNMKCHGFVRAVGATIAPGAKIHPVSGVGGALQTITVRVLKEKNSGNWWVYYGFNSVPTAVGYYPRSLFTSMADHANYVDLGGFVSKKRGMQTPPMGSGVNPKGAAQGCPASFSDLRFIDRNGRSSPIMTNFTIDLMTNEKCYSITHIVHAKCFYGGPSGCLG